MDIVVENKLNSKSPEQYKTDDGHWVRSSEEKSIDDWLYSHNILHAVDNKFKSEFPTQHKTDDGHWVRSSEEKSIDDWLYSHKILHAYERNLPVKEHCVCDFYIPAGDVYIEFWGLNEDDPNNEKYSANKKRKLEIYDKYSLKLIQLTDEHLHNLDDILPKQLLKYIDGTLI